MAGNSEEVVFTYADSPSTRSSRSTPTCASAARSSPRSCPGASSSSREGVQGRRRRARLPRHTLDASPPPVGDTNTGPSALLRARASGREEGLGDTPQGGAPRSREPQGALLSSEVRPALRGMARRQAQARAQDLRHAPRTSARVLYVSRANVDGLGGTRCADGDPSRSPVGPQRPIRGLASACRYAPARSQEDGFTKRTEWSDPGPGAGNPGHPFPARTALSGPLRGYQGAVRPAVHDVSSPIQEDDPMPIVQLRLPRRHPSSLRSSRLGSAAPPRLRRPCRATSITSSPSPSTSARGRRKAELRAWLQGTRGDRAGSPRTTPAARTTAGVDA
jgi:hypothetical protein